MGKIHVDKKEPAFLVGGLRSGKRELKGGNGETRKEGGFREEEGPL